MFRRLRLVALTLAALALLLALTLALLPSLVRLERYRDLVAARLSRVIGHEVSLGAIRLRLWGGPGAEVRGLRIADRPGESPVVVADRLLVHLDWRPLLRGELRIRAAELDHPRVHVTRRADGHWNIEDLGLPVAPTPLGAPGRVREGGPRGAGPLAVVIRSVTVRDGQAVIEPGRGLPPVRMTHVAAEATQAAGSGLIHVRATGRIAAGLPAQFALDAQIRPEGRELDPPAIVGTLKVTEADFAPLLRGLGALASGPGPVDEWWGPGSVEGTIRGGLERFAFRARADLGPVAFAWPGRLRKAAGEAGSLALEGRVEGSALTLDRFEATLRGLRVEGKASAGPVATDPIRFEARSPRLDLRQLLARPAAAAGVVGGSVAWAADAVSPAGGARGVASGGRPAPAGSRGTWPTDGVAVEGLVRADEIVWDALRLTAATARVAYRQRRLRATAIRAIVAGGTLEGEAEIDLRGRESVVRVKGALAGVRAEELTAAILHAGWTVAGQMDLRSSLAWSGWPGEAGLESLHGDATVRVTGGRVTGYRPLDRLSDLLGPFLPAAGLGGRLEAFDELAGHFVVAGGTLRTDDLALRQGSGEVRAVGSVGLSTRALDLDVTAKLKRATVEAKVSGTTASPVVTPKLTRLERRIEAEVDKALRGERGQKIRDVLKGLLKQ